MSFLPFLILGIVIVGGAVFTVELAHWAVSYGQTLFIYGAGILGGGALLGFAVYKLVD